MNHVAGKAVKSVPVTGTGTGTGTVETAASSSHGGSIEDVGAAVHQPSTSSGPAKSDEALTRQAKKRGTSSYLDELLATRAAKKQRKKNKAESKPG